MFTVNTERLCCLQLAWKIQTCHIDVEYNWDVVSVSISKSVDTNLFLF